MKRSWLLVGWIIFGISAISGFLWWATRRPIFFPIVVVSACTAIAIAICAPGLKEEWRIFVCMIKSFFHSLFHLHTITKVNGKNGIIVIKCHDCEKVFYFRYHKKESK